MTTKSSAAKSRLAGATLTGADERTSLADLVRLMTDYPILEVGLLYTATPEGRNRYPSLDWLEEAAKVLEGRFALHICGAPARQNYLNDHAPVKRIVDRARRIQVNGDVNHGELLFLAAKAPLLITQYTTTRVDLRYDDVANHQLLVDGSGGRGLLPTGWERPTTPKAVGFAGGLSAANLAAQLSMIRKVAKGAWWVDAEGSLRTGDWFDLAKCRAFLTAVLDAGVPA